MGFKNQFPVEKVAIGFLILIIIILFFLAFSQGMLD